MSRSNPRIEKHHEITSDLFPEDHKYLTFLKKVFRHEFRKNGFRRISTDIIEDGKLRSCAETWIMKAYLNNDLMDEIQPIYYYYIDHFFNDSKQEEWIWTEIIWENDPVLDAISIYIIFIVLNKIWLEWNYKIFINSIWIDKEKLKYCEELQNYYENKKHLLTEESLALLEDNPMTLLSTQNEDEKILASQAPNITKYLKKDSKAHYVKFKEYLDLLEIPYIEDHTLISWKDYSTNTVYEIKTESWVIIWKGNRHNNLAKKLGSIKEVYSTWFYTDAMVIINMLKEKKIKIKNKDEIDLFFVQLWDEAKKQVLPLSIKARNAWINTVISLWTPSMKEQMLKANRSWAKYVVMVWIMEARSWVYQLRNTETGTQEEINKDDLIDYVIERIGTWKLDFYCPAKDLITE